MKTEKITIIGDLHGRDIWRQIVDANPDSDLYIFMGDYFDSFNIDIMTQMHNFRDLINFKKENTDKVITLLGNHDFHYTSGCIGTYSGFHNTLLFNMKLELDELIRDGVLIMAHQIDKYLFTHAGVTKTWANEVGIDVNNLVDSLNEHLIYKPKVFNFRVGKNNSAYGDDLTQGPLWVRPNSLIKDCLDYIHVVGHTEKMIITGVMSNNNFGYILVDTLNGNQYLELIIDDNQKTQTNIKKI
jgi:predicted MPP superfamily phosphohydrolase